MKTLVSTPTKTRAHSLRVEALESRLNPTVTVIDQPDLRIHLDADQVVAVGVAPSGKVVVTVDGLDTILETDANAVTTLTVQAEGDFDNTIDLRNVLSGPALGARFTALTAIDVDGGDGHDTILRPDVGANRAQSAPYQSLSLNAFSTGARLVTSGDDAAGVINLGFDSFNFFGTAHSHLYVSTNGLVTFGSSSNSYQNSDMVASPSQSAIAVFWDDLVFGNTSSQGVFSRTEDLTGDGIADRLVVSWTNGRFFGTNGTAINFQLALQLNTGSTPGAITLNYENTFDWGADATAGMRHVGPLDPNVVLYSYNSPRLTSRSAANLINSAVTWAISGTGAGSVLGIGVPVTFSHFENLTGGGGRDTFAFTDGGSIAGMIDGGSGNNIIDYSGMTTPATARLDQFWASGTIGRIIGSPGSQLVAATGGTTFTVTGADSGLVGNVPWTNFGSLLGGDGNDTFAFRPTGSLSGTVDGQGGSNTLDYSAWTLPVNVAVVSGTATATASVAGINTVLGGAGNDVLAGTDSADLLIGNGGNDFLSGFADDDTFVGGLGNDTLEGGSGFNHAIAAGSNMILSNEALRVHSEVDTMVNIFTASLEGTPGDDLIDASAFSTGPVTLSGGLGNDTLRGGGSPADRLVEHGDFDFTLSDVSLSGPGTDVLAGIERVDLTGGAGDNAFTLRDFTGRATLAGGAGADSLVATVSGDLSLNDPAALGPTLTLESIEAIQIVGGTGDQVFDLSLWHGAATVDGGTGVDQVKSVGSGDIVVSDSVLTEVGGTRIVMAGVEAVSLTGGAGDDRIDALTFTGSVTLVGGNGNDQIRGGNSPDSLIGGAGDDSIVAGSGDDFLQGDDGDDTLVGHSGNDHLDGGGGNDDLAGGSGLDTLTGGLGLNQIDGGSDIDLLQERNDDDLVLTNGRLTSGAMVDVLTSVERADFGVGTSPTSRRLDAAGFTGPVTLTGGGGRDTLIGGAGGDSLDGGNGNDRLIGNRGNDTLVGGAGGNVLSGGPGVNTVMARGKGNFTLSNLRLVGPGTDTLSGITRAVLTGGPDANVMNASTFTGRVTLNGGSGDDTLTGGAGNDLIFGGAGNDTIRTGGGRNVAVGGSGSDRILGGAGNDLLVAAGVVFYDEAGSEIAIAPAWDGLVEEWASTRTYADRVRSIRGPTGNANGPYFLDATTIVDDGVADTLMGGLGLDAFFGQFTTAPLDLVTDLRTGESQVNP